MTQTAKTRREKLEKFLASNPNDAFTRYALAMECVNSGDNDAAIENFQKLLRSHPGYVGGYLHFGQFLVRLERTEEARQVLTSGVAAAQKAGDSHAASEMQNILDALN